MYSLSGSCGQIAGHQQTQSHVSFLKDVDLSANLNLIKTEVNFKSKSFG